MNRYLFCLLGFVLLFSTKVNAQFADKAELFGGISYQFVGLRPLGSPQISLSAHYGFGLGFDYILMHSNDQVSLGINPNVILAFSFSNFSGINFLGSAPVYLLARLGAGATPFNEQKVGIGAGIGGSYSYIATSYSSGGSFGVFKTGFMNPSAVVEFQFNTRASNYLFRFNWSLLKPLREVNFGGNQTYPYNMGITGLSVFYSF